MLSNAQRLAAGFVLTFLVGGAAGYFAGHRAPGADATAKRASAAAGPSARSQAGMEISGESERNDPGATAETLSPEADIAGRVLAAVRSRDYFRRRHDIYAVGQLLDRDTILAAMEATRQFPESDRESAQYSLVARWLELDPAAAFAWIGALPEQEQRVDLTREFFHSLGLKDPAAALRFLAEYKPHPSDGEDFTYSVFEAWSAQDPDAAVDAAFSLQDKSAQATALGIALERWAKDNPQGALARVAQIADAELRRSQLLSVLRVWAAEEPQAAVDHVLSMPVGKERNDVIAGVLASAARRDRDAAMQLIEQLPAGKARTEALRQIVSDLGHNEPKVAAEFILALPPGQQRSSVYHVARQFARQDCVAALEWAGRLSSADARQAAVQNIVQEWASDDPRAAAQYCASNSLGAVGFIDDAVEAWARDDAPGALAWARSLPDETMRETAVASAIGALAASDPRQAASLATTMLSGEKQSDALGSIAGAWAAKDPAAAAAWAIRLTDAAARRSAVSYVGSAWAGQDPAAAAAWASRLPDNRDLQSTIAREWATHDSAAAARWLDALPSGDARDSAVSSFSQAVGDADPAGAAAWAATISQPGQRDSAIAQVYGQWKRTDPTAAAAWLRATPALSEQMRKQLLRWDE